MKVILRDNPLLNKDNLQYAADVEGDIVEPETSALTQKFNINNHELILIEAKPLSSFKVKMKKTSGSEEDARRLLLLKLILKGKRVYFSRLFMNDGCFEFSPPEQIVFEAACPKLNKRFQKKQRASAVSKTHLKKITGYLAAVNGEVLLGLLKAAKRDFEFILHFNSEMFHHNLTAKGLTFAKETVTGIYEEEKYTKIIDLSNARERMGFISLYAITFHELKLADLYSVDGIFTLQQNRAADEKKRLAGQEVFELVFTENREEIKARTAKMAQVLKVLALPGINLNITSDVKKNYTLYCAMGDIGRSFSRLILSDDKDFESAIKTAKRLSFYKLIEKYYDELASGISSIEKGDIYKNVMMFAGAADGKKTAGELNFTVK
ncbi:MAG: hypothetical protein LBC86_01035 [Oscillospiraceae bacterium]|jgi:hypothetical protein|nr:hypothetical protein [Oscillospiraceae bacterium]